jgi:hypothetical protein
MERVLFVTGSKGGVGKSTGAIVHFDNFEMRSQKVSPVETDMASVDDAEASRIDVKHLLHTATRVFHLVQRIRLKQRRERQSAILGCRAEIERWCRNCAEHISEEVRNDAPTE